MSVARPPVLKLSGVSRFFGKVRAVDSISLIIQRGEVVGLVGENGAGKSTLLKILAGIERPDEGTMEINGRVASFRGPGDAARAGVGVVHQEQSLFTNLTVAENIGLRTERRGILARLGIQNWRALNREAAEVLAKIGVNLSPEARVGELSFVDRQMVEIARAVCFDPSTAETPLIILDEPTAVLEEAEAAILEREIGKLREFASVIFVSHRLDEIMRICDRVLVMRGGRLVSDRKASETSKKALFDAMVEATPDAHAGAVRAPLGDGRPVLDVRGLSRRGEFHDVSFTACAGHVVALVGSNGSGCGAVARAIYGAEDFHSGTLSIEGRPVRRWSIANAVRAGLAYVPAERKTEGMIGGFSAARNIALVHPGEGAAGPFLKPGAMSRVAQGWFDRLDVRPNDIAKPLAQFSGGNQQKVVMAKWLNAADLKVLILDHPLRGLDVGAARGVNAQIRKACERGAAVILIPDTIEEALEMASEIVVLRDGEVSARHDLTQAGGLSLQTIVAEMV